MGDTLDLVVPLVLGALFATAGGFLYVSEQQTTGTVVAVDAVVVSSEVVNDRPQEGVGPRSDDYRASVEYRYTYDGETYTSTNLCPGAGSACAPSGPDRGPVEEFVAQYPEGESVTVSVPRDAPSEAYLADGGSSSLLYLGLSGFGLVVVLLGLRNVLGG